MGEFCGSCFYEKPTGGVCPHCGYDPAKDEGKYPIALRAGTILNGRYIIGRVLGQGGFGITYVAQDYQTKSRVAIKEYLPTDFAGRTQGTNAVQVYSGDRQENFDYGKEQFLAEAKTLAEFIGNDNIVRIYSYFEEYGTAYLAMEYIDGVSLDKYMGEHGGRLSVEEANELLIPVMEALDWVHSKGIVHRDIAPDNIIITCDGTAKLIDFGAARYSTGEKSKSLDIILKHGFAPKEQYIRRGRQGPFTDVYAMAGTYYYAITGKIPPDAIERMDEDELIPPSTLGVKIDGRTEDALLKAIEISAPERYQHMGEFVAALREARPAEPEPAMAVPLKEVLSEQPDTETELPLKPEILVPVSENKAAPDGLPDWEGLAAAESEAAEVYAPATGSHRRKTGVKILLILLTLPLFAASFYFLVHKWVPATCTEPETCSICGKVRKPALGHNWKDATYEERKTCTRCGIQTGKLKGWLGKPDGCYTDEWASMPTFTAWCIHPFVFYKEITNCRNFDFTLEFEYYNGDPFGDWGFFIRDENGRWISAGTYDIQKTETTVHILFEEPTTVTAIGVDRLSNEPSDMNLGYFIDNVQQYVD